MYIDVLHIYPRHTLSSLSALNPPSCVQGVCQVVILLAASGSFIACSAQVISSASISASSSDRGQLNLTRTGNATGSGLATMNGRTNTVRASSTADGSAFNSSDKVNTTSMRKPPVMLEVDTDPTVGVPTPPEMRPSVPGTEGVVLCSHHCFACPGLTMHVSVVAENSVCCSAYHLLHLMSHFFKCYIIRILS